MLYLELAVHFESWNFRQGVIRNALKRWGFSRYAARRKPSLTDEHIRLRIEWVERHFHLDFEDWCRVIWSHEIYIGDGYDNEVHVTRRMSLNVSALLLGARINVVLLVTMQVHMQVKIPFPWVKAQWGEGERVWKFAESHSPRPWDHFHFTSLSSTSLTIC